MPALVVDSNMSMNRRRSWYERPGDAIEDMMARRSLTETELASRLDISREKLVALIKGEAKIDLTLATILAVVLDGPPRFWLQCQFSADQASNNYRTLPELRFTQKVVKKASRTGPIRYTGTLYLNDKRIHTTIPCFTEEEAARMIGLYLCGLGEAVELAL